MSRPVTVLGISCYYHDAAAALVRDGRVIAAVQEERFDRVKYSNVFPINAINYCLQAADISIDDVDHVAFYEKPFLKLARVLVGHLRSWPFSLKNFLDMMPEWLEYKLTFPLRVKSDLGFDGDVLFFKHHLSHAASAFYVSPFQQAAVLTVDGIGEWASASYGRGSGTDLSIHKVLDYPHSLGLLYAIVTTYLGFPVFIGEGKVMALAAYGKPRFREDFGAFMRIRADGSFSLDERYFNFNRGAKMYTRRFVDLLGPERAPDAEFEEHHKDVAATLQAITEEVLVAMATHVHRQTGLRHLCCAGGVFLNVMANSRIVKETPFEEVFIHPAAGDAGAALGAALYATHGLLGKPRTFVMKHAYLGPSFTETRIARVLDAEGVSYRRLEEAALAEYVAEQVASGKIVGWFQGRLEWGPRALGARSILADPRNPGHRDYLNQKVKLREWFRPYGVAILEEQVAEFFDLEVASPYMLLVGRAKEEKRHLIPSALHVDGTCRLQTVTAEDNGAYHAVVRAFHRRTGIPMIINTSFNLQEPIVCTPEEAFDCFKRARIDVLAMGPFVVEKAGLGASR